MTNELETLFPLDTLTPETTVDEWEDIGHRLAVVVKATPWAVADFLYYGEQHFHDALERAVDIFPTLSYERLATLQVLGERFPPEQRTHIGTLSASMHEEVMRFDDEDAHDLLDQAADEGWNRDQLRAAAREKKRELKGDPIPFPPKPLTAEEIERRQHANNFIRKFNQLQPGEPMTVTLPYAEAELLAELAASEASPEQDQKAA